MATIEQLNFDLIIKDEAFNAKVAEIERRAQSLNTYLSNMLDVSRNFRAVSQEDVENNKRANQILRENIKLEQQRLRMEATTARTDTRERAKDNLRIAEQAAKQREAERREILKTQALEEKLAYARERNARYNNQSLISMIKQSSVMRDLANLSMMYFSVHGATTLAKNLVRVSAEFEKQRISLEAIIGNVGKADVLFEQIKELAVVSPFNFKELVSYTKQLSAYSIPMEELYDTTKMLADVSAGLGVGMDRLVLAYGQIRSAAFLRGQEVRQLTEAGIPILTELQKMINDVEGKAISVGDVFDRISKRQVTFEMVEKVFKDMTSEGGKFYKMQEVLADTLSGKLSNLKDAYEIMFSEIGDKNGGLIGGIVDGLRNLIENYEDVGRKITELVVAYGVYNATLIAVEAVNGSFVLSNHKTIESLVKMGKALTAFAVSNPYALLAAGITALGYTVYQLATAEDAGTRMQRRYYDTMAEGVGKAEAEVAELERLYAKLELATEGTEEYELAKKQIMGQYSEYIQQLRNEGKEVSNLADIYDELTARVRQSAIERYKDKALATAKEDLGNVTDSIIDSFNKRFEKGNIGGPKDLKTATETQKQAMLQWIFGTKSTEEATKYVSKAWLDFFQWMKNDYTKAANTYSYLSSSITKAHDELNTSLGNNSNLTEFAKRVQDALSSFGITEQNKSEAKGWWADEFTDQYEYLDKIRKRRTEILDQMREASDYEDDTKAALSQELKMIDEIFKVTKKSKEKPTVTDGGKTTGKSAEQVRLELQRDTIKDIYNWYNKMNTAGMDDSAIKAYLKEFYPDQKDVIEALSFRDTLLDLANQLEEYDAKSAESIRKDFAGDDLDNIIANFKKAEKAKDEYTKLLKNWTFDDVLEGEGVELKVSKIVKEYNNALETIETEKQESLKRMKEMYFDDGGISEEEYNIGIKTVIDSSDVKKANALTEAYDKAKSTIEGFYKSWRDENIDFTNLSDKTIGQLENMKAIIEGYSASELDGQVIDDLKLLGLTIDDVNAVIASLKGNDLSKIVSEEDEDRIEAVANALSKVAKTADKISEYARESNKYGLEASMSVISNVSNTLSGVFKSLSKGNYIGAIVAAVSGIANYLFESAINAEKLKKELQEMQQQNYLKSLSDSVSKSSTIFGDSWIGQISAIKGNIADLEKTMDKSLSTMTKHTRTHVHRTIKYDQSLIDDLKQYADAMGLQLMDSSGRFITSTLNEIGIKYRDTLKKDNLYGAFEDVQAYAEEIEKYYESMDEAISSMFNDLSSNIADQMIDSLWAVGSAVTDLEDVFKDLGDTIFKSLVQSYIVDEILSKYQDEVRGWFSSGVGGDELAELMSQFADNVATDITAASTYIEALFESFRSRNLLNEPGSGDSSESSLTNGIKSITEDTANLLASYINAIRADVAFNRMQLEQLLGLLPSSPTLAEYLAQIQANTFNTAEATSSILSKLTDMTTTTDGPALRVTM